MIHIGIDVETVNHQYAVCEFAAIGIDQTGRTVFAIDEVVDPGPVEWVPAVARVHGISRREVYGKPRLDTVLGKLVKELGRIGTRSHRLVAHNASFERRALGSASAGQLAVDVIECTCAMAKKRLPELKSYSLPAVAARLRIELPRHHRAAPDARACAEISRILSNPPYPPRLEESSARVNPRQVTPVALRGAYTDNADRGSNPEIRGRIEQTGANAAGEVVVFTGRLAIGWTKKQAKEAVVAQGGDVMDTPGRRTTIVVIGGTQGQITDADCSSSKARRAKALKCRLMSEGEFLRLLGVR